MNSYWENVSKRDVFIYTVLSLPLNGMKISINRCHIRHMPLLRRFVNYSIRVDAIYYEGMCATCRCK